MDDAEFLPIKESQQPLNREEKPVFVEVETKHGVKIKILVEVWAKMDNKDKYTIIGYS